jgi:hypothetical protein
MPHRGNTTKRTLPVKTPGQRFSVAHYFADIHISGSTAGSMDIRRSRMADSNKGFNMSRGEIAV